MSPRQPARITWGLRLKPYSLDRLFWESRTRQLQAWDLGTIAFHVLVCVVLIYHFPRKEGLSRGQCAMIFAPPIVMETLWALSMLWPAFYVRRRLLLIGASRVMQSISSLQTSSNLRHMIWTTVIYDLPLTTHLAKLILIYNPVQVLIEASATKLQFAVQAAAVALKLGGLTLATSREYIRFADLPGFRAAARACTFFWGALVQPAMPLAAAPVHPRLQGRSSEVFLSVAVLNLTTTAVVCYLVYLAAWLDLRLWAKSLLHRSAGRGAVLLVEGVAVPREQLEAVASEPRASRLLRLSAPSLLLHATSLLLLCQAAHVASQWLVHWALPHVVSERLLGEFYPLLPASERSP